MQERNTGTKSDFLAKGASSAADEIERRMRWRGIPISQLTADTEEVPWLWRGYLARKFITIFTGLWKSGKSTLVSHLLKALGGGVEEFAGQPVTCHKVLVVTEEAARHWIKRRDALGLQDHVSVISRPFLRRPNKRDWEEFLTDIALQVAAEEYALVVLDSLPNLWPVRDENNAADVTDAMYPLLMLTEAGAAVLCLAHPTKGDATEGRATRGSGATPGFVDVIIEMRRFAPDERGDTRRVFTAFSRFDETPEELVLHYDPTEGYTPQGTRADAKATARRDTIISIVPEEEPGDTIDTILANWPEETHKPARRTLAYDLDLMASNVELIRTGGGKRNDPFKYKRNMTDPAYLRPVTSILQETPISRSNTILASSDIYSNATNNGADDDDPGAGFNDPE